MAEMWKKIADFNNYSISNFGNIKNNKKNNILKLKIIGNYYIKIVSTHNKPYNILYIHELVAKYFLDNLDNKLFIYHLDGNKLNNNVNNLYYYNIEDNQFNCLKGEIYKKIIEYDNYYISNFGNIKNNREQIIKLHTQGEYYRVSLSKDKLYIHELVAKYFLDNPDNKSLIYHLDENKLNNNVNNLYNYNIEDNLYNCLEGEIFKKINEYEH